MSIPTPVVSEKIDETSQFQKKLIRDSIGLNDFPIQKGKTYIVFDAVAGNNDLHLIVGASSTYSILKGDGEGSISYTDTGGTKTLVYVNAGRYIITIVGDFNGIDTNGKTQVEKDKYISVIGGSNYLQTISLPNSFQDCTNLEKYDVPTITGIDDSSFDGCIKLKEAIFPLVTLIGDLGFSGCVNLEKTFFPLLGNIGISSFLNCSILEAVNFPEVVIIGDSGFNNCSNLKYIDFPKTTSIGINAFRNTQIKNIFFPELLSVDSETFISTLLISVNLPKVTSIGTSSFIGQTLLRSINFPLATSIANGAFRGCTSLVNVSFPEVLTIFDYAFRDTDNLKKAYFQKVTSIGNYAFEFSGIKDITLKGGVTIGAILSFGSVILNDLKVDGTETEAKAIEIAINTGGGLFSLGSRLVYGGYGNIAPSKGLIQSKSFISSSNATSTTSSTIFKDTDLIVSITPKSATSKLRIKASLPISFDSSVQKGVVINIMKKVGAGSWTNILFGAQVANLKYSIAFTSSNAANIFLNPSTQIDSPGISDVVQFKITYATVTNGTATTYSNLFMRMITVDEIQE